MELNMLAHIALFFSLLILTGHQNAIAHRGASSVLKALHEQGCNLDDENYEAIKAFLHHQDEELKDPRPKDALIDGVINRMKDCRELIDELAAELAKNELPASLKEDVYYWVGSMANRTKELCTLENFKTGCDWMIRAASLIWSAQIFYSLIF
jgi:hypothetical protein